MNNENAKKILEKYENYTFLEFSVKPALFEEYIQALSKLEQFELIDSVFENYLELLIKTYAQFQNPYLNFSLEICQKSLKISKTLHLLTIVLKTPLNFPLNFLIECL